MCRRQSSNDSDVVLIIEAETEKIVQRIDLPYVDEWPHQLPLNNQLRGRHLALAFLDQMPIGISTTVLSGRTTCNATTRTIRPRTRSFKSALLIRSTKS